jgi:hypothetical protein
MFVCVCRLRSLPNEYEHYHIELMENTVITMILYANSTSVSPFEQCRLTQVLQAQKTQ